MSPLRSSLQMATAQVRANLKKTEFAKALRERTLPKTSAESYLHCLSIVHATFERCMSQATDARLRRVVSESRPKLPLLLADLKAHNGGRNPVVTPAVQAALDLASGMIRSSRNEIELVGYCYFVERILIDGFNRIEHYAKALAIDAKDLSYFHGFDTGSSPALDQIECSQEEVKAAERVAIDAFLRLERMLTALYPINEFQLAPHVTTLNPEAGNHAIPTDPVELGIALRVSEEVWARYPYLERRYGERGNRFTTSGSCWLMTLFSLDRWVSRKSVDWLRRLLATRGIPSLILETHILLLCQSVQDTFPERQSKVAMMRQIADQLTAHRQWHVDSLESKPDLLEEFKKLDRFPDLPMMSILFSAHADEADGITGAYFAVKRWLEWAPSLKGSS